jgi:hypothetical protein
MHGTRRTKRSERDCFPKAGLVREYKPLIIKQARWYSRKYYVDFFDVLEDAVTLAHLAEQKFDPTRGAFGTLLIWELQRLHRWCQREYRRARIIGPRQNGELEDWAREGIQARRVRNRTYQVCWHGERDRHGYLDWVDRHIGFAARVGVARERKDYRRSKPRNYKRWKAALGRENWAAIAAAIGELTFDNDKWLAMRDWMVGDLLGLEGRKMREAAADLGITKGYASKIVCQIAKACVLPLQHSRCSLREL